MRTRRSVLSGVFSLCALLAGCSGTPKENESVPVPARKRTVVDRNPAPKPAWIGKGAFSDPRAPGTMCFVGSASGGRSLSEAQTSAEAQAKGQAGSYMGVRVQSLFERDFKAKVTQDVAVVEEAIRDSTSQVVDNWLEKAVRTESWWEAFDDGTWDVWVLLSVPEQSLNPLTALARRLRLEAMQARNPKDRLACVEGILALHIADRHALYLKARGLEELGRRGDALVALRRLKSLNRGPHLDLGALYAEIGVEPPAGGLETIDLDEKLFRLTPHWEEAVKRLEALAREATNPASLVLLLNQNKFRSADYTPDSHPVQVRLDFPGGKRRPVLLLWIDDASLCQANLSAPGTDLPQRPWEYPLAEKKGEVLLLAFTGDRLPDLAALDIAFDRGVKKEAVERLDRTEVNRLEQVVRFFERLAREGAITAAALARFHQE